MGKLRLIVLCILFVFCTIVRAEKMEVPVEGIRSLLKVYSEASFDKRMQFVRLMKEAKDDPIIKVTYKQFPSIDYSAENKIIEWINSRDPIYQNLGLSLANRLLTEGDPPGTTGIKLIKTLTNQLANLTPDSSPDKIDRVLMTLESIEKNNSGKRQSIELSKLLVRNLQDPKWSKYSLHLENILRTQATDPSVRYLMDRARRRKFSEPSRSDSLLNITVNSIFGSLLRVCDQEPSLIREHREEMIDFLLPFNKNGAANGARALVALSGKSDRLDQIVTDALKEDRPWILKDNAMGAIAELKSHPGPANKLKSFISETFRSNPKLTDEIVSSENGMSDFTLITLFNKSERFELYRSIPDASKLSRLTQAQILGNIFREGTEKDQDLAETFFKGGKDNYTFWYDHIFSPAFPPARRLALFDEVVQGKFKVNKLSIPFKSEGKKVEIDTPEAEKLKELALKTLREAAGQRKLGILPTTSEDTSNTWAQLLINSHLLNKDEIPEAINLIKVTQPYPKDMRLGKLLSQLSYPMDIPTFTDYLNQNFGNRKQMTGRMTEIENLRDDLSKDWKKIFDAHFDKVRAAEYKRETPAFCQALCDFRKNLDWSKAEMGSSFSIGPEHYSKETNFAISNVITLFQLKSKTLCESQPEADKNYEKFYKAEIPPALISLWKNPSTSYSRDESRKEITQNHLSSSAQRPIQPNYFLTSNVLYGLIFGKQVLSEIEKESPEIKENWKDWKEIVDTGMADISIGFERSPKGVGGSQFINYSVAIAASSMPTQGNPFIATMEKIAQKANYGCMIPYYPDSAAQENDSAIYRSVTFYQSLWQHTKKPEYMKALSNCLLRVTREPLGTFHGSDNRADREENAHHVGKRNFAPYYYYGNLYFIAEAFKSALTEEKDPIKLKELTQAKELFGLQLFSQFNQEKKVFVSEEGAPIYPHRIIYQNPLMGLALIPLCEMENH